MTRWSAAAGRSRSPTRSRSRGWRRWRARPTGSTRGCWPSSRGAIWCRRSGCPTSRVRQERERARWRLHLVKHRSMLKHRVHAQLMHVRARAARSRTCSAHAGRRAARAAGLPRPVARRRAGRGGADRRPRPPDHADRARAARGWAPITATWRCCRPCPGSPGCSATRSRPRSATSPASRSPTKLAGYTGLCPKVRQSGSMDRRGPLAKTGPKYLRWALMEAATHACQHPAYRERYQRTKHASAASAAPRSPRSTSPAASPRRSGTCSPATNPSLRQAPRPLWPPDGPH